MKEKYVLSDAISLVRVKAEDQSDVFNLMQTIYPPVYEHLWEDGGKAYLESVYGEANFQRELLRENTYSWRVHVEEEFCGVLRLILERECPDFPNRSTMKLQRIYLHPDTHGKGVGKKIMDWVVNQATQEGKDLLWLECMDSQPQALRFYEKMGFQKGGAFEYPSDEMKKEFRGMIRMWRELPPVSS